MTGWSPAGGAGAGADAEPRCGTHRASFDTNVLIAKTPLGQVKKTTFNPPQDRAYGAVLAKDPEGARAVISSWRGHVPNPQTNKPGPNFMAMNRAAAGTRLVSSCQFRAFRSIHPISLATGLEGVAKPQASLPSDKDPGHTYGQPAGHRPAEVVRVCGSEEPAVKALVQNAYSTDWVRMNVARQSEFDARRNYIKPRPTGATQGHALGALRTMEAAAEAGGKQQHRAKQWKMPRFESKAAPRIDTCKHHACSQQRAHHEQAGAQ